MIPNRDALNEAMEIAKDNFAIFDGYAKAFSVLSQHNDIAVSVSGGKDSDLVVDIISRLDTDKKCRYIWFDTGLEYQATKTHLAELEEKYGITIERYKAVKPIPVSIKEHGVPFVSKLVSEMIERLQKYDFKWEDRPYEELAEEYPKCKSAIKWWCNNRDVPSGYRGTMFNINYNRGLKEFLIANPPPFKISSKCCKYAKKDVAHNFIKENDIDLMITGIRKVERGIRAAKYKTCFDYHEDACDQYRPLFWYTNADEEEYDKLFNIKHSDCYEVWGFTRTGCVGCPFNRNFESDLAVVREREPQMYKACQHIFGQSYEYTRRYRRFQKALKEDKLIEIDGKQYTLDDLLEHGGHT